jgi:hypothetical protein
MEKVLSGPPLYPPFQPPGIKSSKKTMLLIVVIFGRRKIRLIESNEKCRYLKKLTWKGTLRQVFYLSPPLTHCIRVYSILYLFTQGGGPGES